MQDLPELKKKTVQELRKIADELGIEKTSGLKKHDLCLKLLVAQSEQNGHRYGYGILDIMPDGRGFLRVDERKQKPLTDIYVADTQVKRFNLRGGDLVSGPVRPPKENERYWSLLRVQTINEREPEEARNRLNFEDLVPIYPDERLRLEIPGADNTTGRFMDLITPIGRGQRGLIIAPPKAGKTTIIKKIANSLTANYDDLRLIVLLVDERPEEVTDIDRSVDGEVVASTFDRMPEDHMHVMEMVQSRC